MSEMGEFSTLAWCCDGPVLTITLNRPERLNAFNAEMFMEVGRAAEAVSNDPDILVVVFAGAGRAFSSGADLSDLAEGRIDIRDHSFELRIREAQKAFDLVEAIPKPTIAAINGHAVGAGLQLALACDFRIAVTRAKVGLPDVKNGFIPGLGATTRLPKLIGLARAKELIMAGDLIPSEKAFEMGLVHQLVTREELDQAVGALCSKLLSRAPLALAAAKELLNSEAGLDQAAAIQARLFGTSDVTEGINAFLQKRSPKFTGS
jgi:enoyl-CoA hydratase/carnithine racemase